MGGLLWERIAPRRPPLIYWRFTWENSRARVRLTTAVEGGRSPRKRFPRIAVEASEPLFFPPSEQPLPGAVPRSSRRAHSQRREAEQGGGKQESLIGLGNENCQVWAGEVKCSCGAPSQPIS